MFKHYGSVTQSSATNGTKHNQNDNKILIKLKHNSLERLVNDLQT